MPKRRRDLARVPPQVYTDPRSAEHFQRFHGYARSHQPGRLYALVKRVSVPYCRTVYKLDVQQIENVPADGPVILAPNHFSYMDHWFVGVLLPRHVRFMAKSQLFKGRPREWVLAHMGAFPVRRGQHDEEAMATALALLHHGEAIVMYPEGGRSRSGEIGVQARPGIGRLALETGTPLVPIAVYGSERARSWRRLECPPVTVRYGRRIRPEREADPPRERQQEVADEVLAAVRRLHGEIEEPID
ncbi:MAG: lysophospholipid acyltransferase family protein [Solirubrobacteraceae bacterium]